MRRDWIGMQGMKHFAIELRRRRVYRAAGLYVVGAWIAIQVASELFVAFGISESALQYVWGVVVLLFPLAAIFAWLFEITSSGIRRTRSASVETGPDLSLRQIDFVILVALLVIGAMISYQFLGNILDAERDSPPVASREVGWNSIAVPPLESRRRVMVSAGLLVRRVRVARPVVVRRSPDVKLPLEFRRVVMHAGHHRRLPDHKGVRL